MRHEYENRLGVDQLAVLLAMIEFGSFEAREDTLREPAVEEDHHAVDGD